MQRGAFLLDIELELAWGMLDLGMRREEMVEICQRARIHLSKIIALLEEYKIPVTWGILGHLLVHRSSVGSEESATGLQQIKRSPDDEPAFHGRDITDKVINHVKKTSLQHDIACHSFSHQLFSEPNFDRAAAEAEVRRCIAVFNETYGITPKVFIFPKNDVGHLDVLRRNGFVAFRGTIPQFLKYSETAKGTKNSLLRHLSLAGQFASFYLQTPPAVVDPVEESGLINVPASMCFNKKPLMPIRLVVGKALKGIDLAARKRRIFHLFTHEVNFGQVREATKLIEGFEKILAHAKLCREKNGIETLTIRKIAESCHP